MQLIFEILIEEAIEYDSLKSRRLSILSVNFILFKGNFGTRWSREKIFIQVCWAKRNFCSDSETTNFLQWGEKSWRKLASRR